MLFKRMVRLFCGRKSVRLGRSIANVCGGQDGKVKTCTREAFTYLDYNLRQEFDLGILLSLPQYYLKKLGFESYTRGNDVLEKLLAKHGRKHKIVVLSAEDLTLLM